MRPTLLASTISARAKAHFDGVIMRPTYIEGQPGIGKTQIVQQAADSLDVGFMSLHGPLMQAEDFGMPSVTDGELTFVTPGHKFPFVDTDTAERGLIVIDELPQMDVAQQKIMANLVQERELHGRKLKPGWHFVCTGNRQQDRAGANRLLSHLNDRVTLYKLEANKDDWSTWALGHGVRAEVVAFINWRPDLLVPDFDPAKGKQPTPRAWAEGVSPALDVVPKEAELETFEGEIGEGASAEFVAFMQTFRELPDPELILSDPAKAPIPEKINVLYALCGALSHRASPDNIGKIIEFGNRLHDQHKGEFTVLMVRDAIKRDRSVTTSRDYVKWAAGRGAEILVGA